MAAAVGASRPRRLVPLCARAGSGGKRRRSRPSPAGDERVAHASELFCSLPPPSLDEDEARGAGAGTDTGSSSSSDEGEGGAAAAKALAQPHLAEPRGVQLQGEEQGVAPSSGEDVDVVTSGKIRYVTKPLPRVLILHTGGTLGMDPRASYVSETHAQGEQALTEVHLREGTGGVYPRGLQPGPLLANLLHAVPEVNVFANVDLRVLFNCDSCRMGPEEWVRLAKELDRFRDEYDGFVLVHGTDTLSYTASLLSLMLPGFKKPIVVTGSQLPIAMPRTDAKTNLIDAINCATDPRLQEVAVCFGGRLLRGNRAQKVNASSYSAFDSPSYRHLATLGVDIDWHEEYLLRNVGTYRPRFKLDPNVVRIPIVPGSDPRMAYGDVWARGVRGVVLEVFGVGNMPDTIEAGWLPWLEEQRSKGLKVYLTSQCAAGRLHPELYRAGTAALTLGCEGGPQMTPECAVAKMMVCLAHPDIPLAQPMAGELDAV